MFKKIEREVEVPCPDCFGTGIRCDTCKGKKRVKRVVVEIVHEENKIEKK
jgi:DnaJ-class molecular chaperone